MDAGDMALSIARGLVNKKQLYPAVGQERTEQGFYILQNDMQVNNLFLLISFTGKRLTLSSDLCFYALWSAVK